jgi:class 3 adenylate cyclase
MALEMRRKWFELRRSWVDRGIVIPIGLRMGIHSGFCVLGSFGCMDRLQYSAFGSVVNLASRLEGLAEDDEILVSSSSWTMLGGKYAGVAREPATVPGLSRPVHAVRVQG